MQRSTFYLIASLLFLISAPLHAGLGIGKNAPEFTALDSFGKQVSLKDFAGKKVVLEWTNNDCPFVRKHYDSGNMQALQKKYTKEGVVWLSVISSAKGKQGYVKSDKANSLTASRKAQPSHVLLDADGQMGRMYGAKTTPHMYIIDEKGLLKYMGAIDSIHSASQADVAKAVNYIDQGLTELAAGKSISEPLTKPYGCSVKY